MPAKKHARALSVGPRRMLVCIDAITEQETGRPVSNSWLHLPPRPVWLLQACLLIPNAPSGTGLTRYG
jgi:hypothetical protein